MLQQNKEAIRRKRKFCTFNKTEQPDLITKVLVHRPLQVLN